MSTLQCANIHLESTGNNRVQYTGSNTMALVTAGATVISITAAGNVSISSNNLNLGTASKTANGYTYLPNGLLFQWGLLPGANSSSTITFPVAFPTAALSVTVTPASVSLIGANTIYVGTPTTTTVAVRSAATATNFPAYFTAIGY